MRNTMINNIVANDVMHNGYLMLRKGTVISLGLAEVIERRGYAVSVMNANDFKDMFVTVSGHEELFKGLNMSDTEVAAVDNAHNFASAWNLNNEDSLNLELACALYRHDMDMVRNASFVPAEVAATVEDLHGRVRPVEVRLTTMARLVIMYTRLRRGTSTRMGLSHEMAVKALESRSFEYDDALIAAIA